MPLKIMIFEREFLRTLAVIIRGVVSREPPGVERGTRESSLEICYTRLALIPENYTSENVRWNPSLQRSYRERGAGQFERLERELMRSRPRFR